MEKISLYFANETCNIFPIESSYHKVFNSSSKILSKTFQPSKFVISPRKEECINANSTNEKSLKYSKKNSINNKKEINYEYRPICRKLDFSDNSDNNYNYNNSNFSISDNENIEINEDFSDFSNDAKNSDYSSSSLEDGKQKKRKNNKNKKHSYVKEFTFMKKKQSLDDISFNTNKSKFDEEYVIIKTLCKGEMGTVYLCFRIKDKKKYVVKMSKYFSRKYDYDNMINFVNDINRNSSEPGSFFIQKYIDFWIEDIDEKNNKSTANNKNMYIVTDYCINGNLKEYISNIKKYNSIKLNYSFYWDIIFQMIIPINFLHKLGYIHFDIKPTNYLVMNNNQLLLNDFCLSIKEENIGRISTDELEGDSIYISPELFYKDVGIITHKNDIFSLGLSILELLTEIELPKNGSIWQKMRNHEIPKEFLEKIPLIDNDNENRNKFIELIIEMTQINSNLRPELDLLLNDENKFPELYNRYQMLKNNRYLENTFINIVNTNCCNEIKLCKNIIEEEKVEPGNINESNENINALFVKRSNSMKCINQNSSSEKNIFAY
jgi:serine/threonine protein kinase